MVYLAFPLVRRVHGADYVGVKWSESCVRERVSKASRVLSWSCAAEWL